MAKFFKKICKVFFKIILSVILLAVFLLIYFNWPVKKQNDEAQLGITFSSRYASDIGLDWKKTYIAILDDLGARKIRIPVYWDLVEKEEGQYDFSNVDWQLSEAGARNADIILVIGQKVPRWPECAIPEWYKNDDQKRKENLLKFIDVTVKRYREEDVIKYWQVENEPFLKFGVCPVLDKKLLDKEIALVKSLDSRNIILTDSGELSIWISAAKRADLFGTTLYRTVYKDGLGHYDYPIGPRFFQFKYHMIDFLTDQNKAIVVELQAEPWISGWTTSAPLSEQFNSMNVDKLKENIAFAKKVGFPEIYLWGAEWWYWLDTEKGHPELWDTAKILFNN